MPEARRRWQLAGLAALAAIVVTVPLFLLRGPREEGGADVTGAPLTFVGSQSCRPCHEAAYATWKGSHHERAMDVATEATVLGDFNDTSFTHRGVTSRFFRRDERFLVSTEGPDGRIGEFEVTHVFGLTPLQQYLVPFPGGRLQCLTVAWDTVGRRWFHLYPDQDISPSDWLHWTRNAQNWNGMCAECHSTNLRKGYDPQADTYTTTWSEISVGCEACHGPGSRHVAWAALPATARPAVAHQGLAVPTSGISSREQVEVCAPCHARRAELGDYDHTGRRLLDHAVPMLLDDPLYFPDGQQQDEVYVYGSFLQSKMYARDVRCSDCHDSHSGRLVREGNALCLQCHEGTTFDTPAHHFHQTEVEGKPSDGARCVKCHMPERTYMVVDPRADHSFRVPRPDLTAELGVPNACGQSGCHADKPVAWLVEASRRWYGQARRPSFGPAFAAARAGRPGAAADLLRIAESALQPAIVRATALSLLDRSPGPEVTAALRRALADEDPLLRRVGVTTLARAPAADRAQWLAPLLSDPVKAVRLDAVTALADVPRDAFQPPQLEALQAGIAEYRTAMEYSLDFASAGLSLGNLYRSLGQAPMAEQHYRLALKVDDLYYPAKINLAVLLGGLGRQGEAETLLREVVRAYPSNIEAAYLLGLVLAEVGKTGEALAQLRRAAEGDARNARARFNLGLLAQQAGRLDEAEAALVSALALEPANADFLLALAGHYYRRNRPADVLPLAERLIAAAPGLPAGQQLATWARQAAATPRPR